MKIEQNHHGRWRGFLRHRHYKENDLTGVYFKGKFAGNQSTLMFNKEIMDDFAHYIQLIAPGFINLYPDTTLKSAIEVIRDVKFDFGEIRSRRLLFRHNCYRCFLMNSEKSKTVFAKHGYTAC